MYTEAEGVDAAGSSTQAHEPSQTPIVSVDRISKHFTARGGWLGSGRNVIRAVDEVSLCVEPGETLGLVGESGCGKSTLGRLILRLVDPTQGRVFLRGRDITTLSQRALRPLRRDMQIIFQDPYSSLNPRMTVAATLGEAMRVHGLVATRSEERERVRALLHRVGMRPHHMHRYPHEFSGGQRQRIGIARALAVEPRFIVADEPLSALDVSIQAQIVNLLMDLQEELALSYLLISHDLKVVEFLSRRVAVMYLGRIVELAPASEIYARPEHPYTQTLLAAVPDADPTRKRLLRRHASAAPASVSGDAPTPGPSLKSGCPFFARCPKAKPGTCDEEPPPLGQTTSDHLVACHFPG